MHIIHTVLTQNSFIVNAVNTKSLGVLIWGRDQKCSHSSFRPHGDLECLDTSYNFLYINLCNILSFRSNFQFEVPQVPFHFFFLTETEVFAAPDGSIFPVPSYFPFTHFQADICCEYVHLQRHHLNIQKFLPSGWLQCCSLTKCICAVQLCSYSSNYVNFFYLLKWSTCWLILLMLKSLFLEISLFVIISIFYLLSLLNL